MRRGAEWIGGIASMRNYVTGEGGPYRPEILLWIRADGVVLGTDLGRPGELLARAGASLRGTIERPMVRKATTPARVRVATPELAAALRAEHPGLAIVCAPTPEVDAVIRAMDAHFEEDPGGPQSYLGPGISPEAVAAHCRAAAALHRRAPWKDLPGGLDFFVTSAALQLEDAVLSVIGQMEQAFGWLLFASIDDFEDFVDASDAMESGAVLDLPSHLALNFEGSANVDPELRKEVSQHRWEIAGADTYPWLTAIDEDLVARPPTADELRCSEALCLALIAFLKEGKTGTRTLTVPCHGGDVELTLWANEPEVEAEPRPPFDVLADLAALEDDSGELDSEDRAPLEAELLRAFEVSPEAAGLAEVGFSAVVMDLAASFFGQTIATLDADGLEEVVFDLVPRKISVPPSAAAEIVEELRALYAFLKRAYGLPQADACLRVLAGDAVEDLEAELAESSNFGLAKSLLMGGGAPVKRDSGAKKKKRKEARKARRKNRR